MYSVEDSVGVCSLLRRGFDLSMELSMSSHFRWTRSLKFLFGGDTVIFGVDIVKNLVVARFEINKLALKPLDARAIR